MGPVRLAFRRARGGAWYALGTVFCLLGLALVPFRIEIAEAMTVRGSRSPVDLHAGRVSMGWRPWDDIVMHDVELRLPVAGGVGVPVRADRVTLEHRGVVPLRAPEAGAISRVVAEGVRIETSPLRIVGGRLEVSREGSGLHVRGWGRDGRGGQVDLTGVLSASPPHLGQLQIFFDGVHVAAGPARSSVAVEGAVVVDRLGQESDRTRVTLRLLAAEPDSPAWLDASLEGALERLGGVWLDGPGIRVNGVVRDLGTEGGLWACHGPFDGALELRGATGRIEARLDLDAGELRLRSDPHLDKPAGVPAALEVRARIDSDAPLRAEGEVRIGRIRGRLSAMREAGWDWEIRTGWLTIPAFTEPFPVLAEAAVGGLVAGGRTRATVGGRDFRVRRTLIEVADLSLLGGGIQVPHARVTSADRRAVLSPATWRLAGQPVEVGAELWREEGSRPWSLGVRARADRISVDPLADLLPQELGPDEEPPTDFEGAANAAVRWLHTRAFFLKHLEIEHLRVDVNDVVGEGMPGGPLRIEGSVEDRVIRVRMGEDRPEHVYCLDLKLWRPRLSLSTFETEGCPRTEASAAKG